MPSSNVAHKKRLLKRLQGSPVWEDPLLREYVDYLRRRIVTLQIARSFDPTAEDDGGDPLMDFVAMKQAQVEQSPAQPSSDPSDPLTP